MLPHHDLRQIGGDERFAFFRQRAGDQQFFQRQLLAHLVKPRAQGAEFFRPVGLFVAVEEQHGLQVRIPFALRAARQQRVDVNASGWTKSRRYRAVAGTAVISEPLLGDAATAGSRQPSCIAPRVPLVAARSCSAFFNAS